LSRGRGHAYREEDANRVRAFNWGMLEGERQQVVFARGQNRSKMYEAKKGGGEGGWVPGHHKELTQKQGGDPARGGEPNGALARRRK